MANIDIQHVGGGRHDNLTGAKGAKKDEFYTRLGDIEAELRHYKAHFDGKIVLCNCDDPYESNFFKYFALNFNELKLKKLIATCYSGSPMAQKELPLFCTNEGVIDNRKAFRVEINEVSDVTGSGCVDLSDVEWLIKNGKNVLTELQGDGDFRSAECVEFLKEADIVVTNPPFSLFREYVAQLVQYDKKFLIMGNQNAVACKNIFPLIKDNKVWYGVCENTTNYEFRVPSDYPMLTNACREDSMGRKFIRVKGVKWFTNLDIKKRHDELPLYKRYNTSEYPHYDNYDAINVNITADIPDDFEGIMGVPISFLDKYCPEQFEIIGSTQRGCHSCVPDTKKYDDYIEVDQSGQPTGYKGSKTNENPNMVGKGRKKNYFINRTTGHIVHSLYSRIFIRNRHPKKH